MEEEKEVSTTDMAKKIPEEILGSLNTLLDFAWQRGISDAATAFTQWGHEDPDRYWKWLMHNSRKEITR